MQKNNGEETLYKVRKYDNDDEEWFDKVEEEGENAVKECFEKEEYDYIIVDCGYIYRFNKDFKHADDFVNLNAVCTDARINPKFKKDALYILSTFKNYLGQHPSIVFKRDGFNLQDLMDVGHCGYFCFKSLETIKKVDNTLVLKFDTESG